MTQTSDNFVRTPDDRPFTYSTPGRLDTNGVTWYACDPYPTWYRWEDGKLHRAGDDAYIDGYGRTSRRVKWADGFNDYKDTPEYKEWSNNND